MQNSQEQRKNSCTMIAPRTTTLHTQLSCVYRLIYQYVSSTQPHLEKIWLIRECLGMDSWNFEGSPLN